MEYKKIVIGKYTLNEDGTVSSLEWNSPVYSPLRWDGKNFSIVPNANWVNPEIVVAILNAIMDKARSLSWIESQLLSEDESSLISTVLSIADVLGIDNFDPNSSSTIRDMVSSCNNRVSEEGPIMNKLKDIEEDTTETNRQLGANGEVGLALSELANDNESLSGKIDTVIDNLDSDKEDSFAHGMTSVTHNVLELLESISDSLDPTEQGSFASVVTDKLISIYTQLDVTQRDTFAKSVSDALNKAVSGSIAKELTEAVAAIKATLEVTGDKGSFVNWLTSEFDSIVLPPSTLLAITDAISTNCNGKMLSNANYVEMERALRGMSVNLTDEAKSNIIAWMQQNLASSYAKWVELAAQYSNQELEFASANNALGVQLSALQRIISDVAGINQSLNSLGGWTGSIEQASNRLLQTKDQLVEVSGNFCTLLNSTVDSNLSQLKKNLESSVNQFITDMAKNQANYQTSELAIKTKELEIKNAELSLKRNEFEYSKVQQQDLNDYRGSKLKAMNEAMMSEIITRAVEAVQRQFNASRDEQIKIAQLSKPSL